MDVPAFPMFKMEEWQGLNFFKIPNEHFSLLTKFKVEKFILYKMRLIFVSSAFLHFKKTLKFPIKNKPK